MAIDPIERVDLFGIQQVSSVTPVAKERRQEEKKGGLFWKEMKQAGQEKVPAEAGGIHHAPIQDGFSPLERQRIAREEAARAAFEQKVRRMTEQLGDKLQDDPEDL